MASEQDGNNKGKSFINIAIERSSLGRDAYIGDLYDARTDTFPNVSIFNSSPPASSIRTTDAHFSEIKYINSDKLTEKFEKLNISGDLRASLITGLVPLEGHGKYFSYKKTNEKSEQMTLLYSIKTVNEQLNLFNKELKEYYSLNALNLNFATHVITGVTWGAKFMITCEHKNSKKEDKRKIEGALKGCFNKISVSVNGKADFDNLSNEITNENNFEFQIHGGILPKGELPQTIDEIISFMKKIPEYAQQTNQGKGKPIQYVLIPIYVIDEYLNGSTQMANRLIEQLDESAVIKLVNLFDSISNHKQQLQDLIEDLESHKYCVKSEKIENLSQSS